MNLVGKIFTVLIFLMCVVFGTFALMSHAAHKNWKVEALDYHKKWTEATKEKLALVEEKKNLETARDDERARVQKRLIALEQVAKNAIAQRDENDKKIQIEEGKSRELAQAIQGLHKTLAVMQTAIDGMQKDIKVTSAERDKLQNQLVAKTDDLINAVNELDRVNKLMLVLSGQVVKLRETLAYYKLSVDDWKTAPPETPGEVTAVPRPDVVEISLGADDGVRKGHKFVVTRPSTGKYIGIIEVIQVDYPNRAVCRPDKASQNDQIQKGDRVQAYTKPR